MTINITSTSHSKQSYQLTLSKIMKVSVNVLFLELPPLRGGKHFMPRPQNWTFKPRRNDRSISTQHTPTLLAQHFANSGQMIATIESHISQHCCACLATLLRRVATSWVLKIGLVRMPGHNIVARAWPNDYNIMQHPQMLHENLTIFKFEPTTLNTS